MFGPSAAEVANLEFFVAGKLGLLPRYLIAAALIGGGGFVFMHTKVGFVGLALIVVAHLMVWVKSMTNAPGGATPDSPVVWAPAEAGWDDQLREIEAEAERWDQSPWDISNALGVAGFLLVVAAAFVAFILAEPYYYGPRAATLAVLVLAPIWLNGIRTTWNPSELELKADALRVAAKTAEAQSRGRFELVPLLGLIETERGKYPIDARMMLRPTKDTDGPFIGIQVQVALNNVQGTDYPYLYCVILVKEGAELPKRRDGSNLVFEKGQGEGVRYLVVRQHADNSGGWHTEAQHIQHILTNAINSAEVLL